MTQKLFRKKTLGKNEHKGHDIDLVLLIERRYKNGKRVGYPVRIKRLECNTCGEIIDGDRWVFTSKNKVKKE